MDQDDRMIADAVQRYQRGLDALASADPEGLQALGRELDGFPHGEDPYIGRRWITNAIDVGSKESVRWMLRQAVDLNFRDDEGYTPLHSAIDRERPDRYEVLDMLLAAGASVNLKGVNDWTPAHMAAARDDVEALRLLVRYGADLTIRTEIDDYATPLEEARNLGKLAAAKYLESVV
jgi:ankyrin repeat protein